MAAGLDQHVERVAQCAGAQNRRPTDPRSEVAAHVQAEKRAEDDVPRQVTEIHMQRERGHVAPPLARQDPHGVDSSKPQPVVSPGALAREQRHRQQHADVGNDPPPAGTQFRNRQDANRRAAAFLGVFAQFDACPGSRLPRYGNDPAAFEPFDFMVDLKRHQHQARLAASFPVPGFQHRHPIVGVFHHQGSDISRISSNSAVKS